MVSHVNLIQHLAPLDWWVFFLMLLLTFLSVAYGQYLKSRLSEEEKGSPLELLLMGRRLTLPLFVATLVATWYGGIFGVTALAFEKGIYNFITQGVFWYVSYIIFAFFLVTKIREHHSLSLPELAESLFGKKAGKLTAVLNFLNLLPLAYTISLGLFLQALFGGSLLLNTSIGMLVVTIWSLWGGFRAVVFSDLVQFFCMIFAVFLVVVFSWSNVASPLTLLETLPASHLDWTGGESLATLLVWGFIALSTLVDPNFYQRCLAAKSTRTARKGILVSTMIWVFFDLCTTLGALYAYHSLPSADPQSAYLHYSVQILPVGLRGFFLAGILAVILSTLDSYLFNAATCVSYDLFSKKLSFKPYHHHIALISVSLFSILMSTFFEGNVVEVWKTLGSFSAACLLFPLLVGQFFPHLIGQKSFISAVSLGCLGIVSWKVLNRIYEISEVDEFYIGLLLTCTTLLISAGLKKARISL